MRLFLSTTDLEKITQDRTITRAPNRDFNVEKGGSEKNIINKQTELSII